MNSSAAISKIYWPSHLCSQKLKTGFIVGWNVRSFTACIAAVVYGIDVSYIDRNDICSLRLRIKLRRPLAKPVTCFQLGPLVSALSSLTADPQFAALNQACGVNPVVLGVAIVPFADDMDEQAVRESNEALLASPALLEHKETANLWLTIEIKPTYIPSLKYGSGQDLVVDKNLGRNYLHKSTNVRFFLQILRSLHCCGFRYSNVSSEIIFYKQPDARKFQFLSLDPLVLDISQINASGALFDASMSPKAAQKRTKSSMGQARLFISSSGRTVTDDMNVTLQQVSRFFLS